MAMNNEMLFQFKDEVGVSVFVLTSEEIEMPDSMLESSVRLSLKDICISDSLLISCRAILADRIPLMVICPLG